MRKVHFFADRERDKEKLETELKGGEREVIFCARRLGKTALVVNVLKDLSRQGYITAYLDVSTATSKSLFVAKYGSLLITGPKKISRHGRKNRNDIYIYYDFYSNCMSTVQVDEKVKKRLFIYAAKLQEQSGRKVSLSEAIRRLLESQEAAPFDKTKILSLFGILREEGVQKGSSKRILYELRTNEERALARKYPIARKPST